MLTFSTIYYIRLTLANRAFNSFFNLLKFGPPPKIRTWQNEVTLLHFILPEQCQLNTLFLVGTIQFRAGGGYSFIFNLVSLAEIESNNQVMIVASSLIVIKAVIPYTIRTFKGRSTRLELVPGNSQFPMLAGYTNYAI